MSLLENVPFSFASRPGLRHHDGVKDRVMYVELKTGHDTDRGPAWISRVQFSKSGRTVYFHGRTLRHFRSFDANHYDVETGENFWISGPHRDGRDRRYSSMPVEVDADVAEVYARFRQGGSLDLRPPKEPTD